MQGLPGLDPQWAEGMSDAAFFVVGGRCVLGACVRLGGGLAGAVAVDHTSPPL